MDASNRGTAGAITGGQVKAARALLGWTLEELISSSGVPKRTLIRFEGNDGIPRGLTVTAVRTALERAGIEFIAENGGGPGVRLARR
jgi:transcriptional regulator with XRE-family HTH domain